MKEVRVSSLAGWIFGSLVFSIGLLNLLLVHPVPGIIFILLSLIYFPPVNDMIRKKFGFAIPLLVTILQGIAIIWFTLV